MNRSIALAIGVVMLLTIPLCGVQAPTAVPPASEMDGSRFGTLDVGAAKLRLELKLATSLRKAPTEGGNKRFEAVEMPGMNHLFQVAKTGAPSEYETIEETMSPLVLDKVATWIAKQ